MNIHKGYFCLRNKCVCLNTQDTFNVVNTLKQIKRISSISNVTGLFRFVGLRTHALEVPRLGQT